ncbi:TetR family transcriptional regulator [Streptomyces sp. NPDC002018]|uniref:TetR/AcrR family transcriptional regulator n=1 Tax=Streptomyces sp. NPDC002018 TaxID=3364629 RepID=UPI0036B88C2F
MPTAREALLNAGLSALAGLPWSAVRMVDVASAAGVSRQTLYNEFGSKDGLARALVRREVDLYLRGVERLLGERAETVDRLVAVAEWTVTEARARPLLRALLTGCWGEWLPSPGPARIAGPPPGAMARHRAGTGPPATGDLVALVRDRSVAALERHRPEPGRADHRPDHGRPEPGRPDHGRPDHGQGEPLRPGAHRADLLYRSELAVRLALAHLVAPGGDSVGPLVRTAVTLPLSPPPSAPVSAPSPRAGAR